jgi:diadenosine tetraphosphate (Ap4A) HIT family hydrolase
MQIYDPNCAACAFSQGARAPIAGTVVPLPGNWTVNQYGGGEAYLGWLALQPRYHRTALSQLTDEELQSLGPNLKSLDGILTRYWQDKYPEDPVVRTYVVYFFESEFQRPPDNPPFHLHIHVIPRFKSLDSPERLQRTENNKTWVDGWRTPDLARRNAVPTPYSQRSVAWKEDASLLMDFIRAEAAA